MCSSAHARPVALITTVLVLGVLIGACAGALTLLLYTIEHIALGFVETPELPGPFLTHPVRRALSLIIGASCAALLWWLLRTKTQAVPSVRQAVRGTLMPVWQTVAHVLLQIFIVGCGLSVGREVAPRELGAMLAQRLCRWTGLHRADLQTVVAIAAAAGLAGVYNAPLAGGFFAVEILRADVSAVTVGLSFACAALAAWVATLIKGTHTFYAIGQVDAIFTPDLMGADVSAVTVGLSFACAALAAWVATLIKGTHTFYAIGQVDAIFTPDLMGFALIAGLVVGVCGAWFRRGAQWAESHKASGAAILWQLPLAGCITAAIAIWIPQVMGNGRATAQMGFAGRPELAFIPLLLLSFAAKAVVTLMTIRAGASGGVLTPGIALGASMGCALGIVWLQLFDTNSIGVYALIGACALLSASQNAPLMAMTLVMELTEAPSNLYVPVALACNSIGVYALIGACALLSASQNAPLMAMTLVMELTEAPSNLYVPVALACAVATVTGTLVAGRHAGNRTGLPSFETRNV